MPIQIEWLDAARPALPEAAAYLCQRFATADTLDLSQVLAVVPGGRAGRRLLELLVDEAARRQLTLTPPEVTTIGALPERLYTPKKPFASPLAQQLAWAKTLQQIDALKLRPLLPRPPESPDDPAWLDWGGLLSKEHTELAADALDFEQAAPVVAKFGGPAEAERWQTLAEVQRRYLRLLDELELWDRQSARLYALQHREYATTRPLVLVGVVDLNATQRGMLDQVAEYVTALVPAAADWRERFDGHGCLKVECWSGPALSLAIRDEQLTQVEGPEAQAEEVVRRIAAWNGRYRADEITIGFPDEQLAPQVERQLRQCQLPARWGPGKSVAHTGPYRLLTAIAEWLERRAYPEWAKLVRHPDVTAYLERLGTPGDLLPVIDEYYAEHLPHDLSPETRDGKPTWLGDSPRNIDLQRLYDDVWSWLGPLATAQGGADPRPLDAWSPVLQGVVRKVYEHREFQLGDPADAETWQACQTLRGAFEEFEAVPETLRPSTGPAAAIRLALELVRGDSIPARADAKAIELVGWLELPLDDAPGLIVTSFNDGFVPKSVNADPFLPNSVRTHLKIDDNARRFARDAYAASLLLASRPAAQWIVARRDANGDPLPPSRLLFATDPETIARRAVRLFDAPAADATRAPLPSGLTSSRARLAFEIVPPEQILEEMSSDVFAEPLRLSVSDFKSYLSCPYRFLLRKAARCEIMTDDLREMDGAHFGSLAHDVLSAFGKSPVREAREATPIREFLTTHLYRRLHGQFGKNPRPAVLVQAEQLRMRLDAFAELQAQRTAEGWAIAFVEEARQQQQVEIDVDGKPFVLVGRIDRVDLHSRSGKYGVFDYKTSDKGAGPQATHRKRDGQWIDLQLPLYRHLLRSLGVTTAPALGYIVLPKDVAKVKFDEATWDEAALAAADAAAWEVVRRIRAREFTPSADFKSGAFDDFARLCLAGVLR